MTNATTLQNSMTRFSVVTFCKGRLHHLRHSLPLWFRQTLLPLEVIVVDYGCPDGAALWVSHHWPQCVIVRATRDTAQWNMSRARNLGGRMALGETIVFSDADFLPNPTHLAEIAELLPADLVCPVVTGEDGGPAYFGNCAVSRELYYRVRGYDESHHGYGYDDSDFYHRCERSGVSKKLLWTFGRIEHADSERIRFDGPGEFATMLATAHAWAVDNDRHPDRQINQAGWGELYCT